MVLVERLTIPLGEVHYSTRILLLLCSLFFTTLCDIFNFMWFRMLPKSFVLLQVTYQLTCHS
jgi:hypothetical protein